MQSLLSKSVVVTKNAIDYVHWDNSEELVNQLKLLLSSLTASHIERINQIVSMLEKLRLVGILVRIERSLDR
jgi:hypothetical protein